MVLTSQAKLGEGIKFIGVILIKEESFLGVKKKKSQKKQSNRKCKPDHPGPASPEPCRISLFSLICNSKALRGQMLRERRRCYNTIQLVPLKMSCFICLLSKSNNIWRNTSSTRAQWGLFCLVLWYWAAWRGERISLNFEVLGFMDLYADIFQITELFVSFVISI